MEDTSIPLMKEYIKVSMTQNINNFLSLCIQNKLIKEFKEGESIDLDELLSLLSKYNVKVTPDLKINSQELMEGSQIIQRIKTPTDAALKMDNLDFLRRRAKERNYQNLIKEILPNKNQHDSFAEYRQSITLGANLLIGILLTFLAGYWGLLYLGITNITTRAAFGLFFSIICLLVEVVLFVFRDLKQPKDTKQQFGSSFQNFHTSSNSSSTVPTTILKTQSKYLNKSTIDETNNMNTPSIVHTPTEDFIPSSHLKAEKQISTSLDSPAENDISNVSTPSENYIASIHKSTDNDTSKSSRQLIDTFLYEKTKSSKLTHRNKLSKKQKLEKQKN